MDTWVTSAFCCCESCCYDMSVYLSTLLNTLPLLIACLYCRLVSGTHLHCSVPLMTLRPRKWPPHCICRGSFHFLHLVIFFLSFAFSNFVLHGNECICCHLSESVCFSWVYIFLSFVILGWNSNRTLWTLRGITAKSQAMHVYRMQDGRLGMWNHTQGVCVGERGGGWRMVVTLSVTLNNLEMVLSDSLIYLGWICLPPHPHSPRTSGSDWRHFCLSHLVGEYY